VRRLTRRKQAFFQGLAGTDQAGRFTS